jgi:hypothetical protein
VDLTIPSEVSDFARVAREALADPNLARARAGFEGDAGARLETIRTLEELGAGELDVSADETSALAGAHLALELGRVAAPVPIAARLTGLAAGGEHMIHAVGPTGPRWLVDHLWADPAPLVIDLHGTMHEVTVLTGASHQRQLAPLAGLVTARGAAVAGDPTLWAWHECVAAFRAAGACAAAVDLYRKHAGDRVQFGRPLKAFQAVQQDFADLVVLGDGLLGLCHYALWLIRTASSPRTAVAAALAVRSQSLEVLAATLRRAQQIHGATGFCYEHPVSTIVRSLQVQRHVPLGSGRTADALAERISELRLLVPPDLGGADETIPQLAREGASR